MFAYCGNNPVKYIDPEGTEATVVIKSDFCNSYYDRSMAGIVAGGAAAILLVAAPQASAERWSQVKKIARAYMDISASIYADQQPRVHHIVPVGKFSRYSEEAQAEIREMQGILYDVGIDVKNDARNCVILSHGYHKSLHTEDYIHTIYMLIKPAEGNEFMVNMMLLVAKLYVLAGDPQIYE